ncbi:MAG: hypothetical protein JXL80_07730 [Planctomycetes bacterium]|nr:hypothetical protein [Planctomycetota bacterium]
MLRRGVVWAALVLAAAAMAGCQGGQSVRHDERLAAQGHAVHLFGPTALPRGGEDLGYFARTAPQEEPQNMFDYHTVYVRQRTWEVEDNRRPYRSYHRRTTWAEDVRASYR